MADRDLLAGIRQLKMAIWADVKDYIGRSDEDSVWDEADKIMARQRDRLIKEIAHTYRTVMAGIYSEGGGMTVDEMHLEAASAVVGWLETVGIYPKDANSS